MIEALLNLPSLNEKNLKIKNKKENNEAFLTLLEELKNNFTNSQNFINFSDQKQKNISLEIDINEKFNIVKKQIITALKKNNFFTLKEEIKEIKKTKSFIDLVNLLNKKGLNITKIKISSQKERITISQNFHIQNNKAIKSKILNLANKQKPQKNISLMTSLINKKALLNKQSKNKTSNNPTKTEKNIPTLLSDKKTFHLKQLTSIKTKNSKNFLLEKTVVHHKLKPNSSNNKLISYSNTISNKLKSNIPKNINSNSLLANTKTKNINNNSHKHPFKISFSKHNTADISSNKNNQNLNINSHSNNKLQPNIQKNINSNSLLANTKTKNINNNSHKHPFILNNSEDYIANSSNGENNQNTILLKTTNIPNEKNPITQKILNNSELQNTINSTSNKKIKKHQLKVDASNYVLKTFQKNNNFSIIKNNTDLKTAVKTTLNKETKNTVNTEKLKNNSIIDTLLKEKDNENKHSNLKATTKENFNFNLFTINTQIQKPVIKKSLSHLSSSLNKAIKEYKPPLSKISIEMNPKELGKLEVTLVHRGDNLEVKITSHTSNTLQFIQANQNELKQNLINMGYTNINMSFNSNSQQQNRQQHHQKYKQTKEELDEIILEIPEYKQFIYA
jgi:hypothetical protein